MKNFKLKMKFERHKPRLHPDVVETLRHRGGAHGAKSGKKQYDRRDGSWRKEQ